jgi:serine/threonine-protein kinase
MASDSDLEQRVSFLLKTLEEQAETAVRNPRSTVEPTREVRTGRRALEVLQGLTHDDRALVDEGELGRGGMGIVKLARQVSLDRRVAVKTLRNGQAEQDVEALLSEAWLAGSLEHPGILPIHALSLDADGLPVVVMKRIEGVTWSKLLSGEADLSLYAPGRNRLESHLRIAMQLCNAVHFANSRGIVHRDLKPDNVMLGRFGEVYLVDWGIATTAGASSQFAGTPAYMAPEMFGGGSAELSAATDVYLLGSILCEVVSGRPPHLRGTTQEMFQSVLRSEPELPSALPTELNQLIRRCMGRVPSTRYATALEVRGALEAFLEHQGSRELEQQAESRASELLTLLKGTADPLRVSRLFSECRFGFQQALRSWPANARAERGLEVAVEGMIAFELRGGSARHAEALLRELKSPTTALTEAVAQALAREVAKDEELKRLQAVERAYDPRAGGQQRLLVALAVGVAWIFVPLIGAQFIARSPGYEGLLSAPPALLSAAAVAFFGRRLSGGKTVLNLQLLRILVFCMFAQGCGLVAIHFLFGDLGARVVPLEASYWCLVAGIVAVGIIPEAWVSFLGYGSSVVISALWPDWRYEGVAFSNFMLCVNVAYVWRVNNPTTR